MNRRARIPAFSRCCRLFRRTMRRCRRVIALQAALDREDEAQSVRMIKELLKAAATPWEMKNSPLFRHIPVKGVPETYTKQIISPILYEFENSSKYDFLQSNEEFRQLIEQYRK